MYMAGDSTETPQDGAPQIAARPLPRLIIADDHVIVADGLRRLLESDFAVIALVADGKALIHAARELRPDLVIADISMPSCNGIEAVRTIRKELPQTRAICLTMHADRIYLSAALEAGANGFVVKHAAAAELHRAIEAVMRGETYISPPLDAHSRGIESTGANCPVESRISARQRQVLQLIAEGKTVREVASILNISPKTVEFHKYRMMEVLGLRTSAELVQFAVLHGVLSDRREPRS